MIITTHFASYTISLEYDVGLGCWVMETAGIEIPIRSTAPFIDQCMTEMVRGIQALEFDLHGS